LALLYLDTSALVKLYVQEQGTEKMLELAHPDTGNRLVILSLSRIEFRAAVRRRAKLGYIDATSRCESASAKSSKVFLSARMTIC
jgi:predicted nucleic acid-binding protein